LTQHVGQAVVIPSPAGKSNSSGFGVGPKPPILKGWSAGKGLAGVFMIHEFKDFTKSCITS
jgi:hypothetical protein